MDLNDLRVLYNYNAWANRQTLGACATLSPEQFTQDLKSSFPSIRDTLVHIYGAELIWLGRLRGLAPFGFPNVADFPDFESVRSSLEHLDADLIDLVGSMRPETLATEIEYKLLSGAEMRGLPGPMLQHLANHGTYHRGQVTTMLRQLRAKAVSTDLIRYYRELHSKVAV